MVQGFFHSEEWWCFMLGNGMDGLIKESFSFPDQPEMTWIYATYCHDLSQRMKDLLIKMGFFPNFKGKHSEKMYITHIYIYTSFRKPPYS